MNRNQKIIVSIVGIIIVLLALLGITYAYYLTRIEGNTNTNSISLTTAKLELVYDDNHEEIIDGDGTLEPSKTTDIDDAIGTKTFTVTNRGNDSSYVVIIDSVSVTKASDGSKTNFVSNDFRYTLSCTNSDGTKCNEVNDLTIFPIKGGILVSNDIKEDDVHTYTLTMWYIDTGIDQSDDMGKSYQARVNIADVNQLENPFMTGVSATDNASLAYNIIENSKLGKNGTTLLNVPITTPAKGSGNMIYTSFTDPTSFTDMSYYTSKWYVYGSEVVMDKDGYFKIINPQVGKFNEIATSMIDKFISAYHGYFDETEARMVMKNEFPNVYKVGSSTTNSNLYFETVIKNSEQKESVLSVATDDYGTSYYYRGGVTDNYVNFAGMCWRVVRIVGDGSIKLILEDQYTTCDDNETQITSAVYTGNWNIGNGNYGYETKDVDNDSSDDYIMNYLKPGSSKSSSMVKAFYNFQTNKLADYTDKLKAGGWCIGDKAYKRSYSFDSYTYTLLEKPDYSGYIYYDSYKRLTSGNVNGFQPSLKCNGTVLNNFARVLNVSNEAPMYVSTLTVDEIIYSGGKHGKENVNYYLFNNYQISNSISFWTLSPGEFSSNYDNAYYAYHTGLINNGDIAIGNFLIHYSVSSDFAFRPSITLSSNTVIIGGEGTIENPYVIG